jgi:adenosine deaminase
VAGALDALGAERIDHGVRCLEDAGLVARLARERIPLTVCPLSNVRLRVFERMGDHVLPRLLEAGVMATVNSDDPAYFGGYLTRNLEAAAEALALSAEDAVRLARNSLEAAFVEATERAQLLERLDAYVEAFE